MEGKRRGFKRKSRECWGFEERGVPRLREMWKLFNMQAPLRGYVRLQAADICAAARPTV